MIERSHETLSTSRTSQLVRKIGSQNQSVDFNVGLRGGSGTRPDYLVNCTDQKMRGHWGKKLHGNREKAGE